MSLLTEIVEWATTALTPWQRDAMRRILQKGALDLGDFDDLYAMMKAGHGIPDSEGRVPIPICRDHVPITADHGQSVVLHSMHSLQHVNRIAPAQTLVFAPKGITLVYGDNASGKSGYSRVLKRACRARDAAEVVHSDATDPESADKIPEAKFEVELNGTQTTLSWRSDTTSPEELSSIAVFDGRCARAILDDEQDVTYLLYGLDVLEGLAGVVIPELTRLIEVETRSIDTDTTAFEDLKGETRVGRIIESLSAAASVDEIRKVAAVTEEELRRLQGLDALMSEPDPKARAQTLKLTAQRVMGFISRIDNAIRSVDDETVEKLRIYQVDAEAAAQAEALAAADFRAGESLLVGTGEHAWKVLFEAAKKFSEGFAYPEQTFPRVDAGAQCVLCQQVLSPDGGARMVRFAEFVRRDTAKTASEKRLVLEGAQRAFMQSSVGFGIDEAGMEELRQFSAGLPEEITILQSQVNNRKEWIQTALGSGSWDQRPGLESQVRGQLLSLVKKLEGEALELDAVADEERKRILEGERTELRARKLLAERVEAIVALVDRMRVKALLQRCRKDELGTKHISDRARLLGKKAVTETLKEALDHEFDALGVDWIKTRLVPRAEHGRVTQKIVLDLPVRRHVREILSEGEQRAIAIASFLAELSLSGHSGGIVFDDPVSSLDHTRRKRVARRLVQEASHRQVIVFTHDTVFLSELQDAWQDMETRHLVHHLEWSPAGRPGQVNPGLPWEHKSYKDRLDRLEKEGRSLHAAWPPYPGESDRVRVRHLYDLLRATIERVVQDVALNGVVKRFHDYIRVENLQRVADLTEEECDTICRLYRRCNPEVDAHDPSSGKNAPPPSPEEFLADLDDLWKVARKIGARRGARMIPGTAQL